MRISDWSSDVCSSDLETAFSQIAHEKLGLPFEKIRIVEGDTDRIPVGLGTGGSWSVPMGGGAIALAADRVIAKAKRIAAHLIEAAEADRSEENTSELQSLMRTSYAVFCLKKKKNKQNNQIQ